MRFTVRLVLSVLLLVLGLSAASAQRFDPGRLTRDDARLLQAALAHDGAYVGRIDGDWGRRSAGALTAATGREVPREEDVLRLIAGFAEATGGAGWSAWNREGTSALLPLEMLSSDDGPDFFELHRPDRSLVVRYIFRRADRTGDMHRWLTDAHVGPGRPYRAETRDAFVTKGTIESGQTVYLRTILTRGVHETVLVQWTPAGAPSARVVVASLSSGYVRDLRVSETGYLAAMLDRASAPPSAPRPPDRTSSERSTPSGTGTGFYVNGTDLVTAAHVVAGCRAVTTAEGAPLLIVAEEAATDLAVLRGARRSATWIALAAAEARLGAPVTAVGFPYSGLYAQGLSVTNGNISALRGLSGEAHITMLTAPIQPGNSGGPVLDRRGRAVGVVSYRAAEGYVLERSGTLPENMNGATRLETLRRFLIGAEIALPPPDAPVHDLSQGVPEALTDAVVQVHCVGTR